VLQEPLGRMAGMAFQREEQVPAGVGGLRLKLQMLEMVVMAAVTALVAVEVGPL
jgi:hypothetical protein